MRKVSCVEFQRAIRKTPLVCLWRIETSGGMASSGDSADVDIYRISGFLFGKVIRPHGFSKTEFYLF